MLVPEVGNWTALEEHEHHEDDTAGDGGTRDRVENPTVDAVRRDTEQEDADGDFAAHRGPAVCDFAKPPILESN